MNIDYELEPIADKLRCIFSRLVYDLEFNLTIKNCGKTLWLDNDISQTLTSRQKPLIYFYEIFYYNFLKSMSTKMVDYM